MKKPNENLAGDTSTDRAPQAGALVRGQTPISRAIFAELQGVDTRSVNKIKWDQIIQSHLKLELDRAELITELENTKKLLDEAAKFCPVYLQDRISGRNHE